MKLVGIKKIGKGRSFFLETTYKDICEKVFKPNVTHLDDNSLVKGSWGIKDADTNREAFIWSYKVNDLDSNKSWSACGDRELLEEIFGKESIS